ncbi:MAG TPA: MogA/MoaB family molybdenum cofactor biosynthesis protein [Solirubrobacterales bacterium]|nr:MogA/MoaB family molybdenum cofactor biosynthesis protein [Solirubrobacterales bacterium]
MPATDQPRAAILTISSSRSDGGEEGDESGDRLAAYAAAIGVEVTVRDLLPDDRELIAERLRRLCDEEGCALVLTSGGTGLAPDDVTPEATLAVADREAAGIAEAMRLASREHTPHWMLSRNVAAVRGRTLIVNFPGSPKAIAEAGEAIAAALPHALRLLRGDADRH